MSVFDGEIEYQSVYMVDYVPKNKPQKRSHDFDTESRVYLLHREEKHRDLRTLMSKSPRRGVKDDDCLIVGVSRDALKPKGTTKNIPDVLCPLEKEHYKNAVERYKTEYPKLAKLYMSKDIDPVPIEHEIQDVKRTEYLTKYCSRDLPFMSVNLTRRAKALLKLRLPDDVDIPVTSYLNSHRHPPPEKYVEHPSKQSMRPKYDDSLQKELRRILRVTTGESTYTFGHSLLGQVILEKNPYGPPRKEPRYGRWKTPFDYTYRL